MVGGSTTFGSGVFDDETIPFQLEQKLENRNSQFNVEIINAGIPGSQSTNELNRVENTLQQYQPDAIVIYNGWNDLRESLLALKQIENSKNPSVYDEISDNEIIFETNDIKTVFPLWNLINGISIENRNHSPHCPEGFSFIHVVSFRKCTCTDFIIAVITEEIDGRSGFRWKGPQFPYECFCGLVWRAVEEEKRGFLFRFRCQRRKDLSGGIDLPH